MEEKLEGGDQYNDWCTAGRNKNKKNLFYFNHKLDFFLFMNIFLITSIFA